MRKFPIEAILVAFLVSAVMAVFFTYKSYRASAELNTLIRYQINDTQVYFPFN